MEFGDEVVRKKATKLVGGGRLGSIQEANSQLRETASLVIANVLNPRAILQNSKIKRAGPRQNAFPSSPSKVCIQLGCAKYSPSVLSFPIIEVHDHQSKSFSTAHLFAQCITEDLSLQKLTLLGCSSIFQLSSKRV